MRIVSRRFLPLVAVAAGVAVLLQGGVSQAQTVASTPTLKQQVAEVTSLSEQVDNLGQQVDALQLQLKQAKVQEKTAKQAEQRAEAAMKGSQEAVAQLAASGYMSGGSNPELQILSSGNPGAFLGQAATVEQLNNEAGTRVATLQTEQIAAQRAQVTAKEEIANANNIQKELDSKVATIKEKLNTLNSSVLSQALAEFNKTGTVPPYAIPIANTLQTKALKQALTKVGDAYVWGAAGPSTFDCSGLIVWAYAQEGVSLPHYTGSLWGEGEHIPRSELQAGDLVFFGSSIDHVGIYIGNDVMIDAPHTGAFVRIETVSSFASSDPYEGAVRIL